MKTLTVLLILFLISSIYYMEESKKIDIINIEDTIFCAEDVKINIKTSYSSLAKINTKKLEYYQDNSVKVFEFIVKAELIEIKLKEMSEPLYFTLAKDTKTNQEYWLNVDLLTKKSFLNKKELIDIINNNICNTKEES